MRYSTNISKEFKDVNDVFYNDSLISSADFAEKYEMSISGVQVAHHKKNPFIRNIFGILYVDEKALLRRRDFNKRIWNKSHENYYAIAEHISDAQFYKFLSRVLGGTTDSWLQFLKYGLFSTAFCDKSLLSYKIAPKLWLFFRATTFMIRRLIRYETLVEHKKMRRIKSGGLLGMS